MIRPAGGQPPHTVVISFSNIVCLILQCTCWEMESELAMAAACAAACCTAAAAATVLAVGVRLPLGLEALLPRLLWLEVNSEIRGTVLKKNITN
jgi:hypothetical protein